MSPVESLREFLTERLTAAAEEIVRVVEETIAEHKEEVARQRRLLQLVWKPKVKLHRIELPQQHVCKEEDILADEEDPEPLQIKEEQEELCTSQEGEHLVLKQETESDHSERQTMTFNPDDDTLSAAEKEYVANMPVITSVVSQANSDHQLLPNESQSQDQKGGKIYGDSGSFRNAKPDPKKRHHKRSSHSNNVNNTDLSEIHPNAKTGKKSFICDACGKVFKYNSAFQRHLRVHTGEKPYSCKTCGKDFGRKNHLEIHMRTHTGEKPYICKTCRKRFCDPSGLVKHMRVHTREKPYVCKNCGKRFFVDSALKRHMRIHTGGKPFSCKT
ncbi:zinc finger and SCAN domain-containing protein 31-like isoform X4 [Etheostoma cragini]|uniref:zinc finger and SCAN domain-containing protein 31-like isoform X4 n=1 Tax=Etheostoma cragini TaxID=417921 RepID=UPI00155E3F97|nr:zinc finger and SCAN domain-containing protein 31-like isoform X4 [Etheostoma cragini]